MDAVNSMPPISTDYVLLDGHLSIAIGGELLLVPDQDIDQLSIVGVVVIEDNATDVAVRREMIGLESDTSEISDLMEIEFIQARRLARRKNIPIEKMSSHDMDRFVQTVDSMFKRSNDL